MPESENIAAELPSSENISAEPPVSENITAEPLQEKRSDISVTEPGPSGIQLPVLLSPTKQNNTNCTQTSTTTVDPTIPSPFKRALFWPENKPTTSKRMKREKIPAVLTSPQVIRYYQKREEDKQQKVEKQAKRKEEREQKRKETQERKKAAEEQKIKNKEKKR